MKKKGGINPSLTILIAFILVLIIAYIVYRALSKAAGGFA